MMDRADLRWMRGERGWTQAELGRKVGVSGAHIGDIECGRSAGSLELWERLERTFDEEKFDEEEEDQEFWPEQLRIGETVHCVLKRWEFTPGKKYSFRPPTKLDDLRNLGGGFGEPLRLKYLRKEGVHHVFQAASGWLMTWTDAQLAEEEVEE